MELGMIGLGKMGGFMSERLIRGGHRVIGFDRDPAVVQKLAEKGAVSANSLDNIISQLKTAARYLADGAGRRSRGPDDRRARAASRSR